MKKLTSVAAAALLAAALIVSPAEARWGGGWHGGGWHGGGWHGGGWRGAGWRGGWGGWRGGFRGPWFWGPAIGVGVIGAGYATCWRWVPTGWGWRRVWVCGGPYW